MQLNKQEIQLIRQKPILKKQLATNTLGWFSHLYLGHYITHRTPKFHWQIYDDLSDDNVHLNEIIGFRGSAKSTIASLSLTLWSAVSGRKKFIILISDSLKQSKLHIKNIIYELEHNEELKTDFGPFKGREEWTSTNVFLKNNTRIMAISRGQKIRGLRHLEYRPDLIICDDIENIEAVRTIEQRDKTEEWFLSDVFPAIDTVNGKIVVIGSLLHTDSLLSRLKEKIKGEKIGVYKEYPIYKGSKFFWPTKYPKERVEQIKAEVGPRYFMREYLLEIVPDEGQVIKSVQYYRTLPDLDRIGIGVDLAISQKHTADNTAINVIGLSKEGKYYNIKSLAGKWSFNETLEKINKTYTDIKKTFPIPVLLGVEDVAYQKSAIEEIQRRYHLPVKAIKVTTDKRARLQAVEPYFAGGQIFFRYNDDADVVNEILHFGIEQHDDRMDAFVHSINLILKDARPDIEWL